jgi:hypothetical protein
MQGTIKPWKSRFRKRKHTHSSARVMPHSKSRFCSFFEGEAEFESGRRAKTLESGASRVVALWPDKIYRIIP